MVMIIFGQHLIFDIENIIIDRSIRLHLDKTWNLKNHSDSNVYSLTTSTNSELYVEIFTFLQSLFRISNLEFLFSEVFPNNDDNNAKDLIRFERKKCFTYNVLIIWIDSNTDGGDSFD
ncbi:hypothetical protein DERP_004718 [Dermatophagoides pteronyssinus]|uniref:Uncharacterized protein n=1 Tax=Dermatophagoides pteronyssinus TaxID=6956 RepID=A0ABQ8JQ41_DERPT|nr:hypothetical protein DERP_004718 [Dermatophagoides pteronyssinus]